MPHLRMARRKGMPGQLFVSLRTPKWVEGVDEVQVQLTRNSGRMLGPLHMKDIRRLATKGWDPKVHPPHRGVPEGKMEIDRMVMTVAEKSKRKEVRVKL
jgi:hypothetical protein